MKSDFEIAAILPISKSDYNHSPQIIEAIRPSVFQNKTIRFE